ncbi:MAG: hypothetical protein ACE365_04500 [Gammaproteobacteria bacterium]
MKKIIVSTTINAPTEAILKYDAMDDWHLVVVGDKKTPKDYSLKHGTYLSPEDQESLDKPLSDAIGWNCIPRRNIGLLWAYKQGADIISVVDDDNIPLDNWGKDLLIGKPTKAHYYETHLPSFDPIGATNEHPIWHRGYPIQLLAERHYDQKTSRDITADIQADAWQGDPDTDAICRMIFAPNCNFDPKHFPIASNKPMPFNSQNTFISRRWLKHYFLAPGLGRMDDIWISYYVQALGATAIFSEASVKHARNAHNLEHDRQLEKLGDEKTLLLIKDLAKNPENFKKYLPQRAIDAFELYQRHFVI